MKHSSSPHCADCASAALRLPRNAGRAVIWLYRHTLSLKLVGYNCRHFADLLSLPLATQRRSSVSACGAADG